MAEYHTDDIPETWYTWEKANEGDPAPSDAMVEVTVEKIREYVDSEDDTNRLYLDEEFARGLGFKRVASPISMICRVAPNRRREIMESRGFEHPVRPTPFARWQCKTYAPLQVGDVITSTNELAYKSERRSRHFLTWHVEAYNQNGEPVCDYLYTNLWDEGKPEDRAR